MAEQQGPRPDRDLWVRKDEGCETAPSQPDGPVSSQKGAWSIARKVGVGMTGGVVVLAGLVTLGPVPGPGSVILLGGLAILATEFSAPRRLLHYLRKKIRRKDKGSTGEQP